ncbi:hypothetical protein P691DRAFT_812937 [Macrolepiota fuliginosa MF-IS2]|uniref:Uncharacterized protein n=1 Tax=Macrolepiota fuliginosa MF-IS2 TaxID=1400762 RepID=A0A9P5XG15_9AGAR|nr:hypothetical protein P691DRAFT_812937 [Macrolepiota fuliginosa MF-IS2]
MPEATTSGQKQPHTTTSSMSTKVSRTETPSNTEIVPVSTITADPLDRGSSVPPQRNNGRNGVYSRAEQLEQARFRLLFIVWPAMFGLSMAL